jgi:hypothetical protein
VKQGRAAELAGAFHHLILDDPEGFSAAVLRWHDGTDRQA